MKRSLRLLCFYLYICPYTITRANSVIANNECDNHVGEKKVCSLIAKTEKRRLRYCKQKTYNLECPVVCGSCCKDDDNFSFQTRTETVVKCNWLTGERNEVVNRVRKSQYCQSTQKKDRLIKWACAKSCGHCPQRIPYDENPTFTPSAAPSLLMNIQEAVIEVDAMYMAPSPNHILPFMGKPVSPTKAPTLYSESGDIVFAEEEGKTGGKAEGKKGQSDYPSESPTNIPTGESSSVSTFKQPSSSPSVAASSPSFTNETSDAQSNMPSIASSSYIPSLLPSMSTSLSPSLLPSISHEREIIEPAPEESSSKNRGTWKKSLAVSAIAIGSIVCLIFFLLICEVPIVILIMMPMQTGIAKIRRTFPKG